MQLHEVLDTFTPVVEGISLDEAFLDITGAIGLYGAPETIAARIKDAVLDKTGLACSVGGSRIKFLAKMASKAAKPKLTSSPPTRLGAGASPATPGILIVAEGSELDFLHPHPVEALWGVGPATASKLHRMGISTVGDLAAVPPQSIQGALGSSLGALLAQLSRGVDVREVVAERPIKSLSQEQTFPLDRYDAESLGVEVANLADLVAGRARRAGMRGRTVTLKVRYADMTTRSRSHSLPAGTDSRFDIADTALGLLGGLDLDRGVRLLGVGLSNLVQASQVTLSQLTLDLSGGPEPLRGEAERKAAAQIVATAVEEVRRRFGPKSVTPAALVGSPHRKVGLQNRT
jgi:DNA polymerase-4